MRKPVQRLRRPCWSRQSSNIGRSAVVKLTMPKRRPSMAAAWKAASEMPTTGTSSSSFAAASAGSPKTAITAAS
jgi:hypothetical protein